MKSRILKLVAILVVTLFTSSVFADRVIIFNGYRGHTDGYRGHYPRHADRHDYRPGGWHGEYALHHHHDRPHYYRNYGDEHAYRGYGPRVDYRPYPGYHQGYRSYTPVVAGSLIGGVLGAEFGGDPAALGGAPGASIGCDIAHRQAYRH